MTRVHYPHFAFSNLYLENGYHDEQTEYGQTRRYENEDGLEQAIRRLVLYKPSQLRGWDLRFLRRGINLSQAEFGRLLDRDGQTVARWEKSEASIPAYVDLAIRARFAQRFDPNMSIDKLCGLIDGRPGVLPDEIIFRLIGDQWVNLTRTVTVTLPIEFAFQSAARVPSVGRKISLSEEPKLKSSGEYYPSGEYYRLELH